MLDWFYVAVSLQVGAGLLGCCSLATTLLFISFLAFIRYICLPADCDAVLWLCEHFGRRPESLKGQVVWITGASSGIGAALAVRLARAGVRLALSARSKDGLDRVKRTCLESGGVGEEDVLVVPLDMLQYDQHEAAFDAVLKHFGELDILVNNAGRSQRGRWEEIQVEVDRELFELNVFSVISLSRLVVKYFLARGKGHLAVTSSTAGRVAVPLSCSYNGSKHALHGYFDGLRIEKAGQGLAISLVCPGPVVSNLGKACFTEKAGQELGKERQGAKLMTAERCAELFAITLANKLQETWIMFQPVLFLTYVFQYAPLLARSVLWLLPPTVLMKIRDGQDDLAQQHGATSSKEEGQPAY